MRRWFALLALVITILTAAAWIPSSTTSSNPNALLRLKTRAFGTTTTTMSANSEHKSDDATGGGGDTITIIGFGSLLSERSSRLTFPNLTNFRLGRVPKYRRVFGHPASIFFQRKIANLETLEISSLSVEYVSEDYPGFVATIYEVPTDNQINMEEGVLLPSQAFLEREEEFDIKTTSYLEWDGSVGHRDGVICTRSTDEAYLKRWSKERFDDHFQQYGVDTIWNWPRDSGMRPCAVYLRHCYLSAKSMGEACLDSFLDDTYMIDRTTTIRHYLAQNPQVLETMPPLELVNRYSG